MKIRKIEYFEDQLRASSLGKEVLTVLQKHSDEVMYLITKNRPTMVCWQRNHGPKFIRSFVDSGFEEDIDFIKEIEGIKIESLVLHMAEVLQDYGTQELKSVIGKYVFTVLQILKETNSLRDVIDHINSKQNIQQNG